MISGRSGDRGVTVGVATIVGTTVGSEALLRVSVWVLGRMMMLAMRIPTTRRIGRTTQSVSSLFKFFMTHPVGGLP
ncbi:MAG: hypothetical protein UV06_C0002G0124 [Candidatus Collierbacteria bacterium GW2011_GWA2_42_17]|uniref:Uncharacterized protein n=1 Tax=Candidatus Collierbacteria bacterium GW2011_GWA2_42_17 TaxID=1618378 RepID=A0A0G0Z3A8_9BACT|nr:MAG: hypothetical protein UU94_C0008G0017 [Candidatus Collierbacteria bacterium GW2011_GWB2_42_12]KKS43222.1 MAG: hypothetical protein UV06_C0002G0124 [Candidatus Collierbacteria bacterium GW2011_GWA2_42_17]KKS62027.1 MAG: hypothetical protein UV29_C0025G0012 [Candidatus Collierbacteria bacterium GW2011_GWD2_42_50]KKS64293.1 MAG: hypothetical protein UV32_C0018G0015 [Candidatus Collierbacteria bacterium GW2011_GWF2_42_51]